MSVNASSDILVCGAGVVGMSAALAFARSGWQVTLIDAGPPPAASPGAQMQLRVSTLNPASRRLFEALGAWAGVEERRAYAFSAMYVWDAGGAGHIRFDAASLGAQSLGHVVENEVMRAALYDALRASERVALRFEATPSELEVERRARCTLAAGETLEAALLVGADGHDSWVRKAAGLGTTGADYGQTAVVCAVRTERSHEATAWQRFLAGGPVAVLPLGPHTASIVWSLEQSEAARLRALDDEAFGARLAAALEHRLGAMSVLGPRAGFPLRRQQARRYVAPRVALIGDAAHTIHPLAGQGVNLGLMDAAALAQCLPHAPRRADAGDWRALRAYERWRRGENQLVSLSMDGFHHLFGNDNYWLRWLRNAGLTVTDGCGPVKRALARRAMGLTGELPLLAQGGGAGG